MKKRLLSILLALALCLGLLPATALAAQTGVTVSFETAIYSISKETFVRTLPEPASMDECGPDEYVTVCAIIKNTSGAAVTLQKSCISIDGGDKLVWGDLTIEAGKSLRQHVFHVNKRYLTPGLHTATVYVSDKPVYSGRFSIGRQWDREFDLPTAEEIASCQTALRVPSINSWLQIGSTTRYSAYSVDVKADYLPRATYLCVPEFYMDLSSLKKEYVSVTQGGISGYAGLQHTSAGKYISILSFWDILCTDAEGNTTTIRAKRTYCAEKTDNDSFGNEGTGAHTIIPYDWQAGRWYRMVLLCGTSKETGNTTVEQWFMDLATGEWHHACTYDTGIKDSCFIGDACLFLENYDRTYAGEIRSMEATNIRIRTVEDGQWHDVTSVHSILPSGVNSASAGPVSWQGGADTNSFYIISTGVEGKGAGVTSETLTIRNTDSRDPLEGLAQARAREETSLRFSDVPTNEWYTDAVTWAVANGVTSGTGNGKFSPGQTCSQAQILTFLWRAKGEPKPVSAVSSNEYYAKAAQWAKEQGLTEAFSAEAACTRAMAVTYLWKLAGSPVEGASGFADVPADSGYAQAVAWAVKNGVTAGTSTTTFSPDSTCTRGQIVTFLYRALVK